MRDIVKKRAITITATLTPTLLPFFVIRLILIGITGTLGFNLLGLIPFEFLLIFFISWGYLKTDATRPGHSFLPKSIAWTLGLTPILMTLFFGVCYIEKASSLTSLESTLGTALAAIPAFSTLGFVGLGILGLPFVIGNGLLATAIDYIFSRRNQMELAIAAINDSHDKLVRTAHSDAKGLIKEAFVTMEEKRKNLFQLIGPNPNRKVGEIYLNMVRCERAVLHFWKHCEKVFSRTEIAYQRQTKAALVLFDAVYDASLELLDSSNTNNLGHYQSLTLKINQATAALESLSRQVGKLKTPKGTANVLDMVQDELKSHVRLVEKFKEKESEN